MLSKADINDFSDRHKLFLRNNNEIPHLIHLTQVNCVLYT